MQNKKLEELANIENLVKEKISEKERVAMMGRITSKFISAMAKYVIKDRGYGVATRIMERELREIGKADAKKIKEIFGFNTNDPETLSKVLKIAAMILGLELGVVGDETVVRNCPQGMEALALKQPILCNFCLEYNNGMVEEMLGREFYLDRINWIFSGDDYCAFKLKKR
jgi:predicted hydrocarbon binding protein